MSKHKHSNKAKLSNTVGKILDVMPEVKTISLLESEPKIENKAVSLDDQELAKAELAKAEDTKAEDTKADTKAETPKPDESKPDESKPDESKPDESKPIDQDEANSEELEEGLDKGIASLQAQIAEQELLESQLKAKKKAIKLLAETVLTPERYQRMLDDHLGKIDAAQIAFDELAPGFYEARSKLTAATELKNDFVKLYGARKIQHKQGKAIGKRWGDNLTRTNDTLTVETTLRDHEGKFSYDLPVSPQKEILQQAWKDLRAGFIDFFDGAEPELDARHHEYLRSKLSTIKSNIARKGLVFID